MTENQKNTLILAKGGEKYVFVYDKPTQKILRGVFGRFAANPELNFSWHDAAVLSKKIRENEDRFRLNPGLKIETLSDSGG
jgi:hypothetical protein